MPRRPRSTLRIAQGLGALVVVVGCASPGNPSYGPGAGPCLLDPSAYASCVPGHHDCQEHEDCAKVAGVGPVCVPRGCACGAVSSVTCDPTASASGCGPGEECLPLGAAGPACVSRTCACDPVHEIYCDPTSSPTGCGPNETCIVYGASARCTPYSCGVCDGDHPCAADAAKPFCHRASGRRPQCEACGDNRNYHPCDPASPTIDCLPGELCLVGLVSTATAVCVPQGCRCQIGSRSTCDPTSPNSGCLPDESCFDPGVATAGPPGCLAKGCFP